MRRFLAGGAILLLREAIFPLREAIFLLKEAIFPLRGAMFPPGEAIFTLLEGSSGLPGEISVRKALAGSLTRLLPVNGERSTVSGQQPPNPCNYCTFPHSFIGACISKTLVFKGLRLLACTLECVVPGKLVPGK